MFFVTGIRNGGRDFERVDVVQWARKFEFKNGILKCPMGCAPFVDIQVYDSMDKTYAWYSAANLIAYVQKEGTEILGMSELKYSRDSDKVASAYFRRFRDLDVSLLNKARMKLMGIDVTINSCLEAFSDVMVRDGVLVVPGEVKGISSCAYSWGSKKISGVRTLKLPCISVDDYRWLYDVKRRVLPDMEWVEFSGDVVMTARDLSEIKLNVRASGKISLTLFKEFTMRNLDASPALRPSGKYILEDSMWRRIVDFDNFSVTKKKL